MNMKGQRIKDPGRSWEVGKGPCPGDYWKDENNEWRGISPNKLHVWLKNHYVEEHDDGTISVLRNSIIVTLRNRSWHGFIDHGVWKEVA